MRESGGMDRRARRTRRLIGEALVALLLERRYDRITVREIIDRADVGRSTFYAHFRDKEAVLTGEFERVLGALHGQLEQGDAANERQVLPSLALFRHVADQRALYHALVRGHGIETLRESGHRYLRARVEVRLASLVGAGDAPAIPLPLLADHLVGTFFSLLRWWFDHGMEHTPEQLQVYFEQLTMPAVRSIMGGNDAPPAANGISPAGRHAHSPSAQR